MSDALNAAPMPCSRLFLPKLRSLFLPSSPPSILFYIPRFFLSLTPFLVLNIFLLLYFLSLFRPIFFSWHFLSLYCLDPDLYLSFKFFTILTCSFFLISISISRYLFPFCSFHYVFCFVFFCSSSPLHSISCSYLFILSQTPFPPFPPVPFLLPVFPFYFPHSSLFHPFLFLVLNFFPSHTLGPSFLISHSLFPP